MLDSFKPIKGSGKWMSFAIYSIAFLVAQQVSAQPMVMSSTTSTEQSGLFSHLLPEFKKATGLDIKVVALGTGQALDMARRGDADVVFVESGGDNLAATFSPELSDLTIYVIDVAAGEKIPRKGGPGITKSDLFVINKTDLAPHVGADLSVMEADTIRMRTTGNGVKPFVMTNLRTLKGLIEVVSFIEHKGLLVG